VQRPGGLRAPLEAAISAELKRVDVALLRVYRAFCVFGMLIGGAIAASASRGLGFGIFASGVVGFVWTLVAVRLVSHGARLGMVRALMGVVDALIPWALELMLVYSEGADFALGSWIPPTLMAAILSLYTIRFRIIEPIFFGVAGAVLHLLL